MSTPTISIIIPTCNRPDALAFCLRALQPQLTPMEDFQVLVLDDSPDSATRKMVAAQFHWACWHQGPRRGPAANRNTGARLAKSEWIIFLDDDCVPRSTLVAAYKTAMLDAVGSEECIWIGPTFRPQDLPSLRWEAPHNPQGKILISCNLALSRQLFLELNGFDERFPTAAFEDTDFEARVRAAGIPVRCLAEAAVDHPLRRVPGPLKLARRWEARVISTLDLGASNWEVMRRLPEHVFKVIVSRFRGQPWAWDTIRMSLTFAGEFACLLWLLPGWVGKHTAGHRSSFWAAQMAEGRAPARFGL